LRNRKHAANVRAGLAAASAPRRRGNDTCSTPSAAVVIAIRLDTRGSPHGPTAAGWNFRTFYGTGRARCHGGCGGEAEVVRVGVVRDGAGERWFERRSRAQRARYTAPPASDGGRHAGAEAVRAGREPVGSRHATDVLLQRRGKWVVSPGCGVR